MEKSHSQIISPKRIIISVDDLNHQIWGSIYQFLTHLFDNRVAELEKSELHLYWTDSQTDKELNLNNKIVIGNLNVEISQLKQVVILYHKCNGHDDFWHIASFLMLEKKYPGKIKLEIDLDDIKENKEASDYIYRLYAFSCLSRNESIEIKGHTVDKNTGEIKDETPPPPPNKEAARTYFPLCKIDKTIYNLLFIKKIQEVDKIIDNQNDEIKKIIKHVQESIKKIEKDFNKNYLEEFEKRYTTLFDKWFILIYFYSLDTSLKNANPYTDKRRTLSVNKTKTRDDNLIAALKIYTYNIQELLQNIIYHTNDQEGYLYVAFIKKDDICQGPFDKTFDIIDGEVARFVEIGIMDCANTGIVSTFKNRNKNLSEKLELRDFFDLNPTKTSDLTGLDMRYAAHLGLKTFVASIKGQNGYFYVESNNDNYPKSKVELCNGVIEEKSSIDFIDGTHYHVIVPVSQIQGLISAPNSQSSAKSFIQQFKDILGTKKTIKVSDTDLSSLLRLSDITNIEERNNGIKELGDIIANEHYSTHEIERELAFEIPDNDGSLCIVQNVYRLINYLQLSLNYNYLTTIVLTNLSEEFVRNFWNLFETHVINQNLRPIWKINCAVVLMSKDLNYRIISGETKDDINALNNEVRKHYCISTNYDSFGTSIIKKESMYFVRPYELLMGNNKYFYTYVDNLLRKCIEDKIQGYCVRHENTYIGNKMIVTNYYEAETLFQNSFFAERFAFLIASKLKKTSNRLMNNDNWYFVGAGYYSDLIIKSLQRLFINSNTMLAIDGDEIDFRYSKEPNQDSKIVVITPIGSTLSLNDKIIAFLMRKFKVNKNNIVHHCVIVVGNKNHYDNNTNDIPSFFETDIEYSFKWKSIDIQNKRIGIKYKNVNSVEYDILIGQRNKNNNDNNWHFRIDDNITFRKNYYDEKYVNRTENQSINSQNLLGLPKLHEKYFLDPSEHKEELVKLKELMPYFYYGHIENHHTHYRYYIHTEEFVAKEKIKNNSCLSTWMTRLKEDQLFHNSEDCLNLIITPNAKIESEFVNYINQEIFCFNAQVINIDAHSWKNNMAHKYKYISDIYKNNKKIKFHYVDHALLTANTYLKTKSFLEDITESSFVFSSVIVLINRVSPNVIDDIAIKDCFRSFFNLFIPESTDNIRDCVLCALVEFYKHFHNITISSDCNKIINKNEVKIKKTTFDEVKKNQKPIDNKKQLRLLFTHELFYRLAVINQSQVDSAFDKYRLTKEMLDSFYSKEMNELCMNFGNDKSNQIDRIISFVKVISSPPLTRYIAVREYAYTKLLKILQTLFDKKEYVLDDLLLLKAVLKSLSFLNSTALVRKTVILNSWHLYNSVFENELKPLGLLGDSYKSFPKELYFNIKNAILDDDTKSMFLNELLRTGKECRTMRSLKENVNNKANFNVMIGEGSEFCDKVQQQYEHFLKWLYYDTTTVLQKALVNFEKETTKDECIKNVFYSDSSDKEYKKWTLSDYKNAVTEDVIQFFKNKVVGNGNQVEYYYENLKLFYNDQRGKYIDKLVRVLYAKLKLERLVDSESNNSQAKIEDDIINVLTILKDIMDSARTFIIFKQDEKSYYEFAVGVNERRGRVDDFRPFINDFFIVNPFEVTHKKNNNIAFNCEYTQINEQSILYFAYKLDNQYAPNAEMKQLLLLLRNNLCQYVKFISNSGLLAVWIEKQRTNEFFKERYRKNTHNALKNLNTVSNNYFINPENINSDYVELYDIMADLHVGKIHNSLLVNKEIRYLVYELEYNRIRQYMEHFFDCAKFYLNYNKIALDEKNFIVRGFSNEKKFYYISDIPFLLFQFIHNIPKNTLPGRHKNVKVSIYIDNDCLVIKNSHSKINERRINELKEILKSDFHNEVLKDSISLYCINYFCRKITGKELMLEIENNNTFVVKIPIIKTIK